MCLQGIRQGQGRPGAVLSRGKGQPQVQKDAVRPDGVVLGVGIVLPAASTEMTIFGFAILFILITIFRFKANRNIGKGVTFQKPEPLEPSSATIRDSLEQLL